MSEAWKSGVRRGFFWGAVGGGLAGIVEGLRVVLVARLGLGWVGVLA